MRMSEVIDAPRCRLGLPVSLSDCLWARALGCLAAGQRRRRSKSKETDGTLTQASSPVVYPAHRAQADIRAGEVVSSTVVGEIIWERQGVKKLVACPSVQICRGGPSAGRMGLSLSTFCSAASEPVGPKPI